MQKIKVLIVDDQSLMRDGLKTIIDLEPDMEVLGTCENGRVAIEKSKILNPDVILMDIRMPEVNGVEATKIIKKHAPHMKIIILTTFDDDEYIIDALSHGASGYLLKDIDGDKLINSIRDAYDGTLLMPGTIAAKLVAKLNQANRSSNNVSVAVNNHYYEKLSEREIEIAKLMLEGLNNKEIASELFITQGTAKNYISSIYSKIGVRDRTNAVLFFRSHGF
ncbi:two component transcriptional regulator, LuxR family [Alkaliphilus metalliredigens QYMF]|uniref:Stage 0 sporulation protein A homolog n=1 Tax=Alkaliphilus metalliredigens (strain QYMF) TaxID=293826 RepID=A6TNH5_ALKMQ|nr:response regulator transcription factor [Alkaliphilus metalliredigens]ABR47743.1 two component transcriptional regulator, LuxR family [Alkaliphilus metalliredigens QYMF]